MDIENFFILDNEQMIPIKFIKTNGRNIIIRPEINPKWAIKISAPSHTNSKSIEQFIEEKKDWINNFFKKQTPKQVITDNSMINFLDSEILIKNDCKGKYGAKLENNTLYVCGTPDMLEHRVKDFFKKEFLKYIKQEIQTINKTYSHRPKRISLKDTRSRWGSCSSSGTLSFSWRLFLAPKYVARYVIVHEIAHFAHMNHSLKFWELVDELYGPNVDKAKKWLNKNGATLHSMF